jgi:hypothetical protein
MEILGRFIFYTYFALAVIGAYKTNYQIDILSLAVMYTFIHTGTYNTSWGSVWK